MRIAIVSPYDPRPPDAEADPHALRGGVEAALDGCASGLAARGHDVTIVTSAVTDVTTRATAPDGVRFVRVPRRGVLFRAPLASYARAIPRDAEVVHVPATYPLVSDLLPLRERARRRATVLDYHFDPHGTSFAMRAAAAAHRRALGWAMRRATRIVTKSLDYARASPFLSRVPASKLDAVPNAVDVPEGAPWRQAGADHLLFVGRLVPYKGVDVLLRAMPAIHAATGAPLVVAGDGPEAARLRALGEAVGAPVDFAGRVTRERLAALYAAARLTVLPSVNSQEAFGIVLLESMVAGTPVVASDLPGVREVARVAGATARAGDPRDLAETVIGAWRAADAFGTPAAIRARVRERYSWRAVLDAWEGVYARAIEEARGPTRASAKAARKAGGPA